MIELLIAALLLNPTDSVSVEYRDSVVFSPAPQVETSLVGSSIYAELPSGVSVVESDALRSAVDSVLTANSGSLAPCYRIRIYLDNRQNSREKSLEAEERCKLLFPGFSTYRTFKSPFFKVTVGDFRTRADAEALLREMEGRFPSAFIVREECKFPIIDISVARQADTIKVL